MRHSVFRHRLLDLDASTHAALDVGPAMSPAPAVTDWSSSYIEHVRSYIGAIIYVKKSKVAPTHRLVIPHCIVTCSWVFFQAKNRSPQKLPPRPRHPAPCQEPTLPAKDTQQMAGFIVFSLSASEAHKLLINEEPQLRCLSTEYSTEMQ